MNKKSNESFSVDFRRLTMNANNPDKETRKTVALMGIIVIIIVLIVAAALYFLKVNLLSAGIFSSVTALGMKWIGKGGRSP